MEKLIFSEISPENLSHFQKIFTKFFQHRLKPLLTSSITEFSLILKDILTLDPLIVPVRGQECLHWECINETSVEFCEDSQCPLCHKTIREYERDQYLSEIISKKFGDKIFIHSKTGIYFPISKSSQIEWEWEKIKFLAIKNSDFLAKGFSYIDRNIGIDCFSFLISFLDVKSQIIVNTPCRSSSCKHLECNELKKVWQKKCEICNQNINENTIYIDLIQYSIILFAKSRYSIEEIRNFKCFYYYPEYDCFKIGDKMFDFEFKEASQKLANSIETRVAHLEEIREKEEILVYEKKTQKKQNLENDFSDNKQGNLQNYHFPEPLAEINELYYDDIEQEINNFLNQTKKN